MQFGRLMQHSMPITVIWSISTNLNLGLRYNYFRFAKLTYVILELE